MDSIDNVQVDEQVRSGSRLGTAACTLSTFIVP